MTEPTLTLLDASVGATPATENFRRNFDSPIRAWKVSDGDHPPDPTSDNWTADGVLISGSQRAVYDDREWIAETLAWVRAAIDAGIPVLGICWGHQAVARAAGGTVEAMGEYELGYATVDRVHESPLFAGIPASFLTFESHSDVVTALPDEATLLAENEVAIQSFRVENAFGVQFHPEWDRETAQSIVEQKRDELPDERIEEILTAITPDRHEQTTAAGRVFENFESLVSERA